MLRPGPVLALLGLIAFGPVACQTASLTAAKLYLQEGDIARATRQLELARLESPENAEVYFLIGQVAGRRGDYAAMDSALARSWSLAPTYRDDIGALRHRYWTREYNTGIDLENAPDPDHRAALRAFARAIVTDPAPLPAWRRLAAAYCQLDSLSAAAEVYQHILASVPDDVESLAGLGVVRVRQRADAEAVALLERLQNLIPDDPRALNNLGIAYERLGRDPEAEQCYLRVTRLAPGHAVAWYNLGNVRWRRGDYPAARAAYETALTLAPDDSDARFNLAMTCIRLGDDARALSLLEQLVTASPRSASAWFELGRLYDARGMAAESEQAYERARSLELR